MAAARTASSTSKASTGTRGRLGEAVFARKNAGLETCACPRGSVVERLNRLLTGWANYFTLGQVSPAYVAIDRHATRRLRQWLLSEAQGAGRESSALPGRPALVRVRAHAPCTAYGELSVGQGMIDLVREPDAGTCTSGSMSGDWKRSHGEE